MYTQKIRTPSVDASKVFYEDSVIWRNMDTEIYISIGCVRCVSVYEAGRSVVNSGVIFRPDPGFFSSLQFANLFK